MIIWSTGDAVKRCLICQRLTYSDALLCAACITWRDRK